MTQEQKVIRGKVGMLELAGNSEFPPVSSIRHSLADLGAQTRYPFFASVDIWYRQL